MTGADSDLRPYAQLFDKTVRQALEVHALEQRVDDTQRLLETALGEPAHRHLTSTLSRAVARLSRQSSTRRRAPDSATTDREMRWFNSDWYRWQNPDSRDYEHPIDHWRSLGCRQRRDPSPFVDFAKFVNQIAPKDPAYAFERLVAGEPFGPSHGIYQSAHQLHMVRRSVHDALGVSVLRCEPTARRFLLWLQNRDSAWLGEWLAHHNRSFDVLVNYYDAARLGTLEPEIVLLQPGTKFTAIHKTLEEHGELISDYDYIWFLDDDIEVSPSQIDQAFAEAESLSADLAQPRLTHDSDCIWPTLKTADSTPIRMNTVEIMMPMMSKTMLSRAGWLFGESVSGFGIDLAWQAHTDKAYLLPTRVRHTSPIDTDAGAYYQLMRDIHINPKAELWDLHTRFNTDLSIAARL